VPETLLVSSQPSQPQARNIGQTQMASLTQQPQSRIPGGPPANWQTVSAQNGRTFADAQSNVMTQQASFARPATTPLDESPTEASSVARPYSEGWYAKRRDQAQAAVQSPAQSSLRVDSPDVLPTAGAEDQTAATAPVEENAPKRIEATPAVPPAAKSDGRVLLEWTRPADQPYRSASELTGVALRETGSSLR
jgi:hypothetical protein